MEKNGSSSAAAASSLAIMEKKKKKKKKHPAGCIAVFLDLFAKKRMIFSRHLLPPPAPSAAPGGGEQLPVPKMMLSVEDDEKSAMRPPGLVARLMGLDAVPAPAAGRPNLRMAPLPETVEASHDPRPREMQNRGQLSAAAAAAAEAAVRRRRSQYKLASPVKSPKSPISGGRSKARLIGAAAAAAAKILEPGLRPRDRTPHSLARLECLGNDRRGSDAADAADADADADALLKKSGKASNNPSLAGRVSGEAWEPRASCEEKRGNDCENFALSDLSNSCPSHGGPGENSKKKTPAMARGLKRASSSPPLPVRCSGNERISRPISSDRNRTASPAVGTNIHVRSRARDATEDETNVLINQNRNESAAANSALKQNDLKQNRLPLANGEVGCGSMAHGRQNKTRGQVALDGAKGFGSSKKNMNNSAASIVKTKGFDRSDVARKRQSSNNLCNENTSVGKPKLGTQQNAGKDLTNGKETGQVRTKPINQNDATSDSGKEAELGNVVGSQASSIVSFTFSSPMKNVPRSLNSSDITEKRGEMKETMGCVVSSTDLVASDADNQSSPQKETAFRQEMHFNLVEQKTREMNSLERGDLEKKCDSIVTSRLNHDCENPSDWTDSHMLIIKNKFQDAAKESTSTALPTRDTDHLIGASLMADDDDGFSGCSNDGTTAAESNFWKNERKLESDFEEIEWSRIERKHNPSSTSNITRSHGICPSEVAIQERKVGFSVEAISNAELLLETIYSFGSDRPKDSSMDSFLREQIGIILSALCMSSRSGFGFSFTEEAKAGNQLRNLLLDCVIECLASIHEHLYKSGYKSWLKLTFLFTKDQLLSKVEKEIVGWNNVVGKTLDCLVEKDMDQSNEIWMNFSKESSQIGTHIGDDILQLLIDEIEMDLF